MAAAKLEEFVLDEGPGEHSEPFHRAQAKTLSSAEYCQALAKCLQTLGLDAPPVARLEDLAPPTLQLIARLWKEKDDDHALNCLLLLLEYCLLNITTAYLLFETLLEAISPKAIKFWLAAVPRVYDSDLSRGTKHRDALLFSLTLLDVSRNSGRVKELYVAVPGIRQSLLGKNAKQFGERFHHLQKRYSRASSQTSLRSSSESIHIDRSESPSQASDSNLKVESGGLAENHFHQRVINVSNAPPVSLRRDKSGWEIKQGSGGLVACVDPVMAKDHENVWLANLGMNISRKLRRDASISSDSSTLAPATNTLGIPLIKQAIGEVLFHVIADDDQPDTSITPLEKKSREEMSLLGVLNNYNRGTYKLNPVVVQEDDYNVYYGGISNGLLWPALHNLPEYIVADYDDVRTLQEHWCAYVRVNYQFAVDAVRNSRPQDFIWIHDYHLMLTGMIMQGMDNHLEVGFFLHIPFQPPDNFFTKYATVGMPIIRGLLRFTKVGFQTHRDREKYVDVVKTHLSLKVLYDSKLDIYTVTDNNWTCSLGVFPVSIKNDDFLKFVSLPETQALSRKFRETVLGPNAAPDARFFFSVERFDYTKGIKEKLAAWRRYFQKYPHRIGKDVLWQIAVTNRRSVDTYRMYQDECVAEADSINCTFKDSNKPAWKAIIFQTDGLPRSDLVAAYLAMDIGVVTPKKDGMNLVAKEMLVVNPSAGLVLSCGAGSEVQFSNAGLYDVHGEKTYKRVADLFNVESYADALYEAATEPEAVRAQHGQKLSAFIAANDIERWSAAFLDPSWTHQVIRPTQVRTLDEFFALMRHSRDVRRQIVERVLKGIPIRPHFGISLRNAKDSLEQSCLPRTKTLVLRADADSSENTRFDIQDELSEFERDLSFIRHVESEDVDNVERFVDSLVPSHPISPDAFREEANRAVELLFDAEHFHYFFTDRDGTLKSYSCSYPASIQPAYSGVIQAQFARRCAQTCAIVTTAPLLHSGLLDVTTLPDGYYYYASSGGREWYIDPSRKFKDTSIPEAHLDMLERVFARLDELLELPAFRAFRVAGSGLQKHYGHITVARQDVHKSFSPALSELLSQEVADIVAAIDASDSVLVLKRSELDLKVMLRDNVGGDTFNKGDGIRLFCRKMKCDLKEGHILVCGDSGTDLPMLEACLAANPPGVYTIWVTRDESLKEKVKSMCAAFTNANFAFVSCPEVLLGAMAQATIREIQISRPRVLRDSQ